MANIHSNATMVINACALILLLAINSIKCQSNVNVLQDIEVSVNGVQNLTNYKKLIEINNHYRWKEGLFANVSSDCSRQTGEYLKALRDDQLWAAKMSDASGHYNGEFFFGNEYWLGSAKLCWEMQLEYEAEEKLENLPPFPIAFFVARLIVQIKKFTSEDRIMYLGECLPSACSREDVSAILRSDLNEIKIEEKNTVMNDRSANITNGDEGVIHAKVLFVRTVPGSYDLWNDVEFFIVGGVGLFVGSLMLFASVYEYYLKYCRINKQTVKNEDVEIEYQNNNYTNIGGNNTNNGNGATTNENSNGTNASPTKPNGSTHNGESTIGGNLLNNNHSSNGDVGNHKEMKKGICAEMLLAFSTLSNTSKIMKVEDSTQDSITCLHGLRFLSLLWVIMVHTYMQLFAVADNKTLRIITEKYFIYQTVGNASYSVDTFFFISGFLLTFMFLKSLERKSNNSTEQLTPNGNKMSKSQIEQYAFTNPTSPQSQPSNGQQQPNGAQVQNTNTTFVRQTCKNEIKDNCTKFVMMLFYRVIRLTPAYLFVIGFNGLAAKVAENNSVFDHSLYDHVNCVKNWWRNILFMNNFFPNVEMCMPWTWYLATDTQFYIVGVIILLIYKRHFKISAIVVFVLMSSSWLVSGYISIANDYRAKVQQPFEMFDQLYDKPWSRLGPYLTGMITGWFIHKRKGRINMSIWMSTIFWIISMGLLSCLIYGMMDNGYLELWPTAFYVSIGHTAWGVSIAWIVIFCVSPQGRLLNKLLSYRGILPLSRLTYCAYLVHPTLMMIVAFMLDGPFRLHNIMVVTVFLGITVISYIVSYVVSLSFEAPVVRLLKLCFSNK